MDTETDLDVALHLADIADGITLAGFDRPGHHQVTVKPDGSPACSVDLDVEHAITAELARRRPGEAVLSEETAPHTDPGSGRCWVIDPLDHTANYLRGIDRYATLIALLDNGIPVVGVVSAPASARRWCAARGQGASTSIHGQIRPIHVSAVTTVEQAYLTFAAIHRWQHLGLLDNLAALATRCRYAYGSGGWWGHMMVAEGRIDISANPWGHPWDLAAIAAILTEAGGRLTDLNGHPSIHHGNALITNGRLHHHTLTALTPTPPRRGDRAEPV